MYSTRNTRIAPHNVYVFFGSGSYFHLNLVSTVEAQDVTVNYGKNGYVRMGPSMGPAYRSQQISSPTSSHSHVPATDTTLHRATTTTTTATNYINLPRRCQAPHKHHARRHRLPRHRPRPGLLRQRRSDVLLLRPPGRGPDQPPRRRDGGRRRGRMLRSACRREVSMKQYLASSNQPAPPGTPVPNAASFCAGLHVCPEVIVSIPHVSVPAGHVVYDQVYNPNHMDVIMSLHDTGRSDVLRSFRSRGVHYPVSVVTVTYAVLLCCRL